MSAREPNGRRVVKAAGEDSAEARFAAERQRRERARGPQVERTQEQCVAAFWDVLAPALVRHYATAEASSDQAGRISSAGLRTA